jgi:hypothetical protein
MSGPMIRRCAALLALAALCGAGPAGAAGPAPSAHSGPNIDPLDAAKDLVDKTLSGVAFLPQAIPATPDRPAEGAASLKTVMFQAYLRPDGSALVRAWDPIANRYTPTDTRPWRGDGATLCLTVPAFALPEALCIALHAWGPAFAGTGINYNAMVKGDVRAGSTLR